MEVKSKGFLDCQGDETGKGGHKALLLVQEDGQDHDHPTDGDPSRCQVHCPM